MTSGVADTLKRAMKALEAERDAEIRRVKATYDRRLAALRVALSDEPIVLGPEDSRSETSLSVSTEKMDLVWQFMSQHPSSRQADIADAMRIKHNMNSGSVSIALRRLAQEGKVRFEGFKERGSNVVTLCESPCEVPPHRVVA